MSDWALVDAYSAYRGRPGHIVHLAGKRINSQGFVSTPELSLKKPRGTIRIAFLGGSAVAGTGITLTDEETWPWRVAERLRERTGSGGIEFINAALSGYTTFESYGRLWSRLRFYQPDIVVVCHAWNEMYYFDHADDMRTWRRLRDGSWGFHRTPGNWASREPLWVDRLIWPSQLLTRVRLVLTRPDEAERSARKRELTTDFDTSGVDIFRTNLRLFRDSAPALGAQVFVAKQPTLIVDGLPASERERCRYHYHGFDHDTHVDAFRRLYAVIDEEIAPDRVIDLTSLSGVPEYFEDHIHPTPRGSEKIAEVVADALLPTVRTKVDSARLQGN
jgi:lysophospholipase L1-like esterase